MPVQERGREREGKERESKGEKAVEMDSEGRGRGRAMEGSLLLSSSDWSVLHSVCVCD